MFICRQLHIMGPGPLWGNGVKRCVLKPPFGWERCTRKGVNGFHEGPCALAPQWWNLVERLR